MRTSHRMSPAKGLVTLAITALALGGFTACGGNNATDSTVASPAVTNGENTEPAVENEGNEGDTGGGDATGGHVYFLNFKPEVANVWQEIAAEYTAETGVPVQVDTAASGTYEQQLRNLMGQANPPTIFQINGPVGYQAWKDYTADLSNTWLYQHLTEKDIAIKDGDGVYGIPYAIEAYGIIYNNAIMQKYFDLPDQTSGIHSVDEIKDFDTLKAVAEDMQAHADELGIKGAFAATSLQPGEDWRWQTHLANVPFYYEFKEDGVNIGDGVPAEVTFSHNANFQNLFDLYTNNSTMAKTGLGAVTVDQSMAEFAAGQAAMVQNGTWAWAQVAGINGNTVLPEDVGFLPLYTGTADDATQGICIGTENFLAINSHASEADQQASIDFLTWLFSSEKGKEYLINDLAFVAPFDTIEAAELPDDPLIQNMNAWSARTDVNTVPWDFTVFPSQQWKNDFGGYLLAYVQGQMPWDQVTTNVVNDWKTQAATVATGTE